MNNFRSDYEMYFIEYYGDIKAKLEQLEYAFLYEELPIYYVILIEEGKLSKFLKDMPDVISIEQNYIYLLSQIEEKDYEVQDKFITLSSDLNGKEINVGIIGTGIDYLDKELQDNAGSRILEMWDQTVEWENDEAMAYGKIYSREEIEEAIEDNEIGENPYNRVSHIDSGGYGTKICKTIGGSKYNSVNQCQFIIVKLKKCEIITRAMNCIKFRDGNLYETYDIVKALKYLSDFNKCCDKPMVVYLPLESNSGGRNGTSVLERYIDYFSNINNNLFIIVNNGNEGDGYRHSRQIIKEDEQVYIPIIVGDEINEQKDERRLDLKISLWTNIYDKFAFKVITPLGEETVFMNSDKILKYEKSDFNSGVIEIIFMKQIPKQCEKEILIKIRNAIKGTWIIKFKGKDITYGDLDMWLPMKELTNYNVNFRYPSKARTLTTPATARNALTNMCYSQYERDIRIISGKPCSDLSKRTQESLVIDSTGVLIEDEYGILKIDGVAASGCVLCWMVIIILQWAITENNAPNIDLKSLKLMFAKASIRHSSDCYSIIDINKLNNLLV